MSSARVAVKQNPSARSSVLFKGSPSNKALVGGTRQVESLLKDPRQTESLSKAPVNGILVKCLHPNVHSFRRRAQGFLSYAIMRTVLFLTPGGCGRGFDGVSQTVEGSWSNRLLVKGSPQTEFSFNSGGRALFATRCLTVSNRLRVFGVGD